MITKRQLLRELAADTPFQPATSLWRAVELRVVMESDFPQGRGLDLGCGDGLLLRRIFTQIGSRPMVGVDLDPRETAAAAESGVYETVHTGSAAAIPEPDASFDFVFSNSVLEHIPDLAPVLGEVARILKPGGIFLFTVPSTSFHALLQGPLIPWGDRDAYCTMIDGRVAHHHYFSPENSAQWLGPAGLVVESTTAYLTGVQLRRWENLARCTSGLLYTVMGRDRHPIEIQHTFKIRRRQTGFLAGAATLLARGAAYGAWDSDVDPDGQYGGLMVRARKSPI
jgi:SAM-dependent methyltransferase